MKKVNTKNLRLQFLAEVAEAEDIEVVAVTVQAPNGALEVIITQQLVHSKIQHYITDYDADFRLRTNPEVQVLGYMIV